MNNNMRLLILTDYRGWFWVSVEDLKNYTSMNLQKLKDLFVGYGFEVEILKFSELDYNRDYNGYFVIYQTSEDVGSFYKDYIEDILLFLEDSGAILIPNFKYFRAHHNKNYMEMLRYQFKNTELKTIKSSFYGNGMDSLKEIDNYPVVIKAAEGAGSRYVLGAHTKKELSNAIKKLSGVFLVNDFKTAKDFIINYICGSLFGKVQGKYRSYTFYRKKLVVQNMIEGLSGDYKVLYYGGKYYTLYRKNRENDFRASGGGRLSQMSVEESERILGFARLVVDEIDAPIIGIDMAFDGKDYHLIEFQMIHHGPYTLQASDGWYEYKEGGWKHYEGKSNLETEFARSVTEFIKNNILLEN
jgi:glutathione synthase/RimK-type ligase-like ATP-grasp enzyme